jgi:hypothetical protein
MYPPVGMMPYPMYPPVGMMPYPMYPPVGTSQHHQCPVYASQHHQCPVYASQHQQRPVSDEQHQQRPVSDEQHQQLPVSDEQHQQCSVDDEQHQQCQDDEQQTQYSGTQYSDDDYQLKPSPVYTYLDIPFSIPMMMYSILASVLKKPVTDVIDTYKFSRDQKINAGLFVKKEVTRNFPILNLKIKKLVPGESYDAIWYPVETYQVIQKCLQDFVKEFIIPELVS